MATRQAIRAATIATLLADGTVAALVSDRVEPEPHAPYPATADYPALFVGTPTTDSVPDDDGQTIWGSTETLAIYGLVQRTAGQDDGDLEDAADVLELAALSALLSSMTWRETCDFDEVRSVKRERAKGTHEGGAHFIQVTIALQFIRRETFTATDAQLALETLRVNLHRIDDTTGEPGADPDVTTDIDCSA